MGAVSIACALDEAQNTQSTHPLGTPLLEALDKHSCFTDLRNALTFTPDPSPAGDADVIVCGDATLAAPITCALQHLGVAAHLSSLSIRECAYQVFKQGTLIVCRGNEPASMFANDIDDIMGLNISVITVDHTPNKVLVGPAVLNGQGATYRDSLSRLAGNAVNDKVFQAKMGSPVWGNFLPRLAHSEALINEVANLIRAIRLDDIDSHKSTPLDTIWAVAMDGTLDIHAVLPTNFMVGPPVQEPTHPPTYVVDKYYGIVKELTPVRHSAYMPPTLHTTQARACDLRRTSTYVNTVFCQGSTLIPSDLSAEDSDELIHETRLAAIGESVERYCSNLIDLKPVLHGSYRELLRKGVPVLSPAELVLFSDSQYQQPGFPFARFDQDLPIGWVEGTYWDDQSPVFVPASLVYVNWYTNQYRHEPKINFPAFAGVAAGTSVDQAVLSGVSEIIERHATMVWWLNAFPLAHLELPQKYQNLFTDTKEPLRPALIHLDNTFNIPVFAGVVHNDTSKLTHVGFSCRSSVEQGALKAWSEALTLQEGAYDLANPDGVHWTAIRQGLLPGRSYKKWRQDRRYLDDFRDDFKDVDDLLIQQEVFLDPRAVERVKPLLDLTPTRPIGSVPELADSHLSTYVDRVNARGMRVITVDITSRDVASCGLHVVRTIIPGTVGNTPAAFPYLGRHMVADEAVRLGWTETRLSECDMNPFPMPHA
ncbi:YcaO-like family protein [Trueperella bernardiae]|uniref:YcaO-like family protein n=1 Tax=Trueperella bernardiae TaxID=59561 RepID=UPI00294A8B2A|nr:YcaO-like family protein [Trueperella bernardiae]MDV6239553.1 YcaO-like family protein [Trueperella bernardiae]